MPDAVRLDLKPIPIYMRHSSVFDGWEALPVEGALEVSVDYDPRQLLYLFESEFKDRFAWEYLSRGPEWVVAITKLRPPAASGEELRAKVMAGLDKVRPHLQADGGDVELVSIDEDTMTVSVKLTGACGSCPSAAMTLKSGVEAQIKKAAPEINGVVPV